MSKRLLDNGHRYPAVALDLGDIPAAPEQPVGDTRRSPGAPPEFRGGLPVAGNVEERGGAHDDLPQFVGRIVAQAADVAEPAVERRGEHSRARGGAHERKGFEREADGPGGRSFTDRNVEGEVLHGRVERLLDNAVQPVDLVDEENFPFRKVRQVAGEVALLFEHRARGGEDVDPEFVGEDARECGLAEAGRTAEEDVVERLIGKCRELSLDAARKQAPLCSAK